MSVLKIFLVLNPSFPGYGSRQKRYGSVSKFGLDTDPYQIFQVLDPDPYQNDTDPQHWAQLMASIIKCSQLEITQYTIPGEYQYQEED